MYRLISSPDAISPESMTAAERLEEVGAILAAGILRLRARRGCGADFATLKTVVPDRLT